jgi:hypothetical protein
MAETRAQRTLVKSPPELWAEISDVSALARHLGEFGEIRITRLEPETAVAWEGDRARGTVQLEPSGWGTKVTLTAEMPDEPDGGEASDEAVADEGAAGASPPEGDAVALEPAPEPDPAPVPGPAPIPLPTPEPEPPPAAEVSPDTEPRLGFFARLFGGRRRRSDETLVAAKKDAAMAEAAVDVEASPVEEPPVDDSGVDLRRPASVSRPTVEEAVVEEAAVAVVASPALDPDRAEVILTGVLDDLGSARHRPFSRG